MRRPTHRKFGGRWRRRLSAREKALAAVAFLSLALCLVWAGDAALRGIREEESAARMAWLQAMYAEAASPDPEATLPRVVLVASAPLTPSATSDAPAAAVPAAERSILPNLVSLYRQNPDLAGWLSIEGIGISYPVMFRPKDQDYYVTHSFDGKKDENGALLVQNGCDPFTPGGNVIIHGHNMKSGRMFGKLIRYKEKAYWKEHPVIRFDTLYERGKYEIVSVFLTQVYRESDNVFKCYKFFGAETQAEFDDFYGNIKALALYDTGVEAEYGNAFITLSTCVYHTENGRLMVVAKKIE